MHEAVPDADHGPRGGTGGDASEHSSDQGAWAVARPSSDRARKRGSRRRRRRRKRRPVTTGSPTQALRGLFLTVILVAGSAKDGTKARSTGKEGTFRHSYGLKGPELVLRFRLNQGSNDRTWVEQTRRRRIGSPRIRWQRCCFMFVQCYNITGRCFAVCHLLLFC